MSSGIVHYVHGLRAGPIGYKSARLRSVVESEDWQFDALDYSASDDPLQRQQQLITALASETRPLVLLGSSMGGWVAAAAAAQLPALRGLFLLCPAFDVPGYPHARPAQVLDGARIALVHGSADEIVPLRCSVQAAQDWHCRLHVVADDHGLHASTDYIGQLLALYLRGLDSRDGRLGSAIGG